MGISLGIAPVMVPFFFSFGFPIVIAKCGKRGKVGKGVWSVPRLTLGLGERCPGGMHATLSIAESSVSLPHTVPLTC